MLRNTLIIFFLAFAGVVFIRCGSIPQGVTAVEPFDIDRYLGKWYEIARIEFRHERNLVNVTADYSMNDDGTLKVINRGYNSVEGRWEEAEGKAKFADDPDEGMLKVSFFGPFYSGYNVIAIDKDYKYALVAGQERDYLWILSRERTIPGKVKDNYLRKAASLGFDTSRLIWTQQ